LDKVRGGSTGPTLGKGREKDQYNNPRTQTEIEDHTNPRMSQRDAGDEEDVGITYHYANIETTTSGSNRATRGMSSINIHTRRRS
jgi:hypothetical protein